MPDRKSFIVLISILGHLLKVLKFSKKLWQLLRVQLSQRSFFLGQHNCIECMQNSIRIISISLCQNTGQIFKWFLWLFLKYKFLSCSTCLLTDCCTIQECHFSVAEYYCVSHWAFLGGMPSPSITTYLC